MKKKYVIILIITLALCASVLFSVSYFFQPQKNHKKQPISVLVSPVKQHNVNVDTFAVGVVQAYSTVEVKSRIEGQLLSVNFKEGDTVESGQILFKIDPRPFQASLEQAQANLERDLAQLDAAKKAVSYNQSLVKKGFLAQQDYDQLVSKQKSLAATIKADQAAITSAKLELDYSTIYSPITGRTGNLFVNPGNLIKPNDANPLVIIHQLSPIYVEFHLSEDKLPLIQSESQQGKIPVSVGLSQNAQHFKLIGELSFINNEVDMTTGTILLKATFENKDQQLWPGQFVRVKLPLAHLVNAILIPTEAIQAGANGNFVFVVSENNRVSIHPITIGPIINNETVVEKGLAPGLKVVISGYMQLDEGMEVQTKLSK